DQSRQNFGGGVVRAVFVSHDRSDHDFAVRWHAAARVLLIEKGVHPFHHALGDARRLAKPDWGANDKDVGCEQLPTQTRPIIAFSLVGFNAWFDIVIGGAQDFAADAVFGEFAEQLLHQRVGRRLFAVLAA